MIKSVIAIPIFPVLTVICNRTGNAMGKRKGTKRENIVKKNTENYRLRYKYPQ
jgi:hypothetical protein